MIVRLYHRGELPRKFSRKAWSSVCLLIDSSRHGHLTRRAGGALSWCPGIRVPARALVAHALRRPADRGDVQAGSRWFRQRRPGMPAHGHRQLSRFARPSLRGFGGSAQHFERLALTVSRHLAERDAEIKELCSRRRSESAFAAPPHAPSLSPSREIERGDTEYCRPSLCPPAEAGHEDMLEFSRSARVRRNAPSLAADHRHLHVHLGRGTLGRRLHNPVPSICDLPIMMGWGQFHSHKWGLLGSY